MWKPNYKEAETSRWTVDGNEAGEAEEGCEQRRRTTSFQLGGIIQRGEQHASPGFHQVWWSPDQRTVVLLPLLEMFCPDLSRVWIKRSHNLNSTKLKGKHCPHWVLQVAEFFEHKWKHLFLSEIKPYLYFLLWKDEKYEWGNACRRTF